MGMFTVGNVMEQFMTYLYYQSIGVMQYFMDYMGKMGAELFEEPIVKNLTNFFQLLGTMFLIFGVVLAIFNFIITMQNGGGGNVGNLIMNIFKGLAANVMFIQVPVTLFCLTVETQSALSNVPLLNATNNMATTIKLFQSQIEDNPLQTILGSIGSTIGIIIPGFQEPQAHIPTVVNLAFIIAFIYCFIKVLFGNLKRGANLLIQVCMGSIYMFSIPRGFMDGFMQWCKQIIGTCLIVFLQNMAFIIGLQIISGKMMLGIGCLLIAGEVPNIVRIFGGSESNVRANIASSVYTATSVINLGRSLAHVV